MKLFGTLRLVKQITHYVARSAVLISFAWAGHAQALPAQIEMRSYKAAKQQVATGCLPCASCYMASPLAARTAGSGDHPDAAPLSWVTRLTQPVNSHEFVTGGSVRPALALRLLYCRWLN